MTAISVRRTVALDRRDRRFGIFSLVLLAVMLGVFALDVDAGARARFVVDPTGAVEPVLVPVVPGVLILAVPVLAVAVVQLTRGLGERAILGVGAATAPFVLAFLLWAAAGQSMSFIGLLRGTIFAATPIAFGSLAGVLSERSGVINIAIEGQFLAAAFGAAVVASVTRNPWVGLVAGVLAGVAVAALLAALAITFRADHIVTGVVLIVLATGFTSFLTSQVLSGAPHLNSPRRFGSYAIPLLADIPVLGPLLFVATPLTFGVFVAVGLTHHALFRTRWGLRVRAVGEKPRAADTVGIPVNATRWKSVLLGGVAAGLGGSWFTLDAVGAFSREMTGGRGFIALAAMLVGRHTPIGAFGAALLFGFATALGSSLQLLDTGVPSSLLLTAPYVVTILVVAGLVGRMRPPAAVGSSYEKE